MVDLTGDLPSKRVCEHLILRRKFAVFWRNNGILGLIPKPCAGIRNSLQPGMTISSKRDNQ
jgi:hypothetical protein